MQPFSSILTIAARAVSGCNYIALCLCLRRRRCVKLRQSFSLNHSLTTLLCSYLRCFEFYHIYLLRERENNNYHQRGAQNCVICFALLQRGCFQRGWLFPSLRSVVITCSSVVEKSILFFFKDPNTISLHLIWIIWAAAHIIHNNIITSTSCFTGQYGQNTMFIINYS